MSCCNCRKIAIAVALALATGGAGCRTGLPKKPRASEQAPLSPAITQAPVTAAPGATPLADSGNESQNQDVALASYVASESVESSYPRASVPADFGVTTVVTPDPPKRPISLAEAVALALENGRTGELYDNPSAWVGPALRRLQPPLR